MSCVFGGMNPYRLLIAGIGGVGGYVGGLLAHRYHDDPAVEVCFLARGEHLGEIQRHGLRVIEPGREKLCHPSLASDRAADLGLADLILICTKSYDLEAVIRQLEPCIGPDTILLPLLNGVDSTTRIRALLPTQIVVDGCMYIISRLNAPGVIEHSGNIQSLHFGSDTVPQATMEHIESLFRQAGIDATFSPNIASIIWEKYIFISPTATATTWFDACIGEIISESHIETVTALIHEVIRVARAKQVDIPENIAEKTLQRLRSLPYSATSSMHTDFRHHPERTELASLTRFVLEQGKECHIATPSYERAYRGIRERWR